MFPDDKGRIGTQERAGETSEASDYNFGSFVAVTRPATKGPRSVVQFAHQCHCHYRIRGIRLYSKIRIVECSDGIEE